MHSICISLGFPQAGHLHIFCLSSKPLFAYCRIRPRECEIFFLGTARRIGEKMELCMKEEVYWYNRRMGRFRCRNNMPDMVDVKGNKAGSEDCCDHICERQFTLPKAGFIIGSAFAMARPAIEAIRCRATVPCFLGLGLLFCYTVFLFVLSRCCCKLRAVYGIMRRWNPMKGSPFGTGWWQDIHLMHRNYKTSVLQWHGDIVPVSGAW